MQLMNAVLGFFLLVAGRPLYWAFVAIAGFFVGMHLAGVYLSEQPEWMRVAAGILAGAVGAVLAMFAVRLAFAVAGFFAGTYLAGLAAAPLAAGDGGEFLLFILGGIIGALVAAIAMDWAIIALSSLMGAGLLVEAFQLAPEATVIAYVALTLLGVAVQGGIMRRRGAPAPPKYTH